MLAMIYGAMIVGIPIAWIISGALPRRRKKPLPTVPKPWWKRVLRYAGATIGALVVIIVLLIAPMLIALHIYEHQAKAEHDRIHVGMTADEVLLAVQGSPCIRAHALLPEGVKDDDLVHYVTMNQQSQGRFGYSAPPNDEFRHLDGSQAVQVMREKMSDGYEWVWRYTFINETPQHFSFSVTFDKSGRVKEITPVWGWD